MMTHMTHTIVPYAAALFALFKVIATAEAIITVARYTMMGKPNSLRYCLPYAITMLLAGELCTALTIIALIATK